MAVKPGIKVTLSTVKTGTRLAQQTLYRICGKGITVTGKLIRNEQNQNQ